MARWERGGRVAAARSKGEEDRAVASLQLGLSVRQPMLRHGRTMPAETLVSSEKTEVANACSFPSAHFAFRTPRLLILRLNDVTEPLPFAIFGIRATDCRP